MITPICPVTILRNGNIHTLDPHQPIAQSLAICQGKILFAGTNEDFSNAALPSASVTDLCGLAVFPSFTDSHIHFAEYSLSLDWLNCDTPTKEGCLDRLARRARNLPPGVWIRGHGWDQNKWGGYGNRFDLDAAAPHNPVYLSATSLHAAWANTRALQLAGVTQETHDPPGGTIQRDLHGEPTGILFENATSLLLNSIPQPSADDLAEKMKKAQKRLWRFGITCLHDFDGGLCLEALQLMRDREQLGLRICKALPLDLFQDALDLGLRAGFGNNLLFLGGVKLFSDGALGPRTAAMKEPYAYEPHNQGVLLMQRQQIFEIGIRASQSGFPLNVHAIGDQANHVTLDAFQDLRDYERENGLAPLPHRIEHVQLLLPEDIERLAELRLTASMQPLHAVSDMEMADHYWGDRVRYAYAWNSLLDAGTNLSFGSDAPVASPNPFRGMHAALTRRRSNGAPGPRGWTAAQRISLQQAIQAYTKGPARSIARDNFLGQLSPGCLADLIVLEQDLFHLPPEALADAKLVGTMIDGVWRYRAF